MRASYQVFVGKFSHLPVRVAVLAALMLLPLVALVFYLASQPLEQQTAFAVICGTVALSLLLGWLGAQRLVLRPLQGLTQAAEKMGAGDWTARTGLSHHDDAMGRLAQKLDELAEHGQRTARAYKALSGGNRALLRERDEPKLLAEMCRVAVEKGGYALAFVNFAEHDADKTIRVVAHHGRNEGFLESLKMTWADTERGQSTIGQAIRSGRHCIIRNMTANENVRPWHGVLSQRGFGAAISLPLWVDAQTIGTFTLLTSEVDAFDDDEVMLLDEMAADLSLGIQNIRAANQRHEAELVAERLLTHDHPTALPNRVLFLKGLSDAIDDAAKRCASLGVLILHVVRLQEVVDGFGYEPGQGVVREVAARLKRAVAPGHLLARLEVDEFAVFLSDCDPASASKLAETLLAAFNEPVQIAQAQIDVSATVGVAFYPGHGADAEALIRRAAIAARDGVNRDRNYTVYRGATERENPSRLALAAELRTTIAKGELVLHYQPKVDLTTNALRGAEALVRWPHPVRGLVSPAQFVSLAEETGLIRPMTTRLVEAAIRQQHMWMRAGRAMPVAVNLSVRNLYDPLFLESLETLLETWGVAANLIDFEITESALVDDPDTAKRVLTRLRQLGSRIYIDDFGTGYSSLNYLVTLPVHALKVDQSFVRQMETSPEAHSVVASIISMAHNLGLEVIAEGVETEAHRKTLAELGCDKMQGYLVSKPLPPDEYEARFLKAKTHQPAA